MLRASCWVIVEPPWPVTGLDLRRADRAGDADRVDAEVAAEAAVLGRDHRRPHFRRDLVVGQPFAEARPKRHENLAVGGADADHLPEVGPFGEVRVARQIGAGDRDRDHQRENAEEGRIGQALEDARGTHAAGAMRIGKDGPFRLGDRKLGAVRQ